MYIISKQTGRTYSNVCCIEWRPLKFASGEHDEESFSVERSGYRVVSLVHSIARLPVRVLLDTTFNTTMMRKRVSIARIRLI